jgi:hypothetical protein
MASLKQMESSLRVGRLWYLTLPVSPNAARKPFPQRETSVGAANHCRFALSLRNCWRRIAGMSFSASWCGLGFPAGSQRWSITRLSPDTQCQPALQSASRSTGTVSVSPKKRMNFGKGESLPGSEQRRILSEAKHMLCTLGKHSVLHSPVQ